MDLYAFRILRSHPLRLSLTVGGIALCIVLMLFLLSVYRGVADGSIEYIRQNRADLWVLQRNATNILRGSSVLFTGHGKRILNIPGVKSASPVLLILSGIQKQNQLATLYLTGFEPSTGMGGPPQLLEGHSVIKDNEIVLDKAFAAKFSFKVGDSIQIQDDPLQIVGISSGTNAFVIQYAFVTLHRAQSLIGIPGLVTCYLVRARGVHEISQVAERIREELPEVEVYDHKTFLQNNIHEMQSGFLPLIYTIASIGVIVLTAILTLLLSINILERRKDFAVLKTLGSPKRFLPRLIIEQALLISAVATMGAVVIFFPMVALIEKIVPEVSTKSSFGQIAAVVFVVGVMSVLSAIISMQKLRGIYPMEAFS
ncbi:MAG: ABC transporter permease [Desulfobacteria bacterium]